MADVNSTNPQTAEDILAEMAGIQTQQVDPGEGADPDNLPEPEGQTEESIETEESGVVEEPVTNEATSDGEATGVSDDPVTGEETTTGSEEFDPDAIIEDWDSTEVTTQPESTTQIDYQALGKELGFDVASVDDIKGKITALEEQSKKLEEAATAYSNVPDQLKTALQFAQEGGDWKSMLDITSVNYDQIDPVALYQNETTKYFKDAEGKVDEEKWNEFLDSKSEIEQRVEGERMRDLLKQQQAIEVQQLQAAQQQRQADEDRRLKEALNDFNQIDSFKVDKGHKQKLYRGLTEGDALNQLFYDSQGNYDYNKIVKNIFIIENFEKMLSHIKNRSRTDTKREVMNKLSNNQTTAKPSDKPEVEAAPVDPIVNYIKQLKQQ